MNCITLESDYADTICLWDVKNGNQRLAWSAGSGGNLGVAFSPDGHFIASGGRDGCVRLWEVVTGKEVSHQDFGKGDVNAVTFSPDGQRLAAALANGKVPCWDFTLFSPPGQAGKPKEEIPWKTAWDDLASSNPAQAFPVMKLLLSLPQGDPLLLLQRVLPVAPVARERIRKLIGDLDHDSFERRLAATGELSRILLQAEDPMRAALENTTSPEVRTRIGSLIKSLEEMKIPDGETLRALRVIWVLQRLGTPEARKHLGTLAAGAPEERQTKEAKFALEFLDRRLQLPKE